MIIDNLLGLSKKALETKAHNSIVAVNNVNSTVELQGIKTNFDNKAHNALFYFDLADNNIMTMAVLKFEELTLFQKLKFYCIRNFRCCEYVGSITFTGYNEAVITYVRENIIKAI